MEFKEGRIFYKETITNMKPKEFLYEFFIIIGSFANKPGEIYYEKIDSAELALDLGYNIVPVDIPNLSKITEGKFYKIDTSEFHNLGFRDYNCFANEFTLETDFGSFYSMFETSRLFIPPNKSLYITHYRQCDGSF